MGRCVCLIRGINVGGRNTLRMQALRELCTGLGFTAIERRLGVAATTRNWKTVKALAEAAAAQ